MMKLRFSLAVYLVGLAVTLLPQVHANALNNPPWRWNPNVWRISMAGNYVHTNQNYDIEAGNFVELPSGNYLETYEFFPRARYNFSRSFSLYAGLNGSDVTTQTGGRLRKKSSVNEVVLGADALLYKGWAHLIASVEGGYPIFQIDTLTNDPLSSDGVWYAQGQLFLYRPWGLINSYAQLGFRGRGEGVAQLFLYEFGLELPFSRNFLIGTGVGGASTAVKDELTSTERTTVTSRVNGGSHYYYAHDPEWIEWQAWAGFSPVKSWQVKGGYAQTFNGRNAAQYGKVFLSLSFDFDPQPDRGSFDRYEKSQSNSRPRKAKKSNKRNSFEPDVDKIDDELFEEDNEPFMRKSGADDLDKAELQLEKNTRPR
jgi:hypothetical protein